MTSRFTKASKACGRRAQDPGYILDAYTVDRDGRTLCVLTCSRSMYKNPLHVSIFGLARALASIPQFSQAKTLHGTPLAQITCSASTARPRPATTTRAPPPGGPTRPLPAERHTPATLSTHTAPDGQQPLRVPLPARKSQHRVAPRRPAELTAPCFLRRTRKILRVPAGPVSETRRSRLAAVAEVGAKFEASGGGVSASPSANRELCYLQKGAAPKYNLRRRDCYRRAWDRW